MLIGTLQHTMMTLPYWNKRAQQECEKTEKLFTCKSKEWDCTKVTELTLINSKKEISFIKNDTLLDWNLFSYFVTILIFNIYVHSFLGFETQDQTFFATILHSGKLRMIDFMWVKSTSSNR